MSLRLAIGQHSEAGLKPINQDFRGVAPLPISSAVPVPLRIRRLAAAPPLLFWRVLTLAVGLSTLVLLALRLSGR